MTRHQTETELSDIRREIARLHRREALLIDEADAQPLPRPGWPMQRTRASFTPQASGVKISVSEPSRIAV